MLYWGAISAQSPGYILGNRLLHSYDYQLHHIILLHLDICALRANYIFLVFDHNRRKVMHFAIATNPFMNWVHLLGAVYGDDNSIAVEILKKIAAAPRVYRRVLSRGTTTPGPRW